MNFEEYFFRNVYLSAQKSKDPSTQVGAVLVRDKIIISCGWNGFARRIADFSDRLTDRDTKYKFMVHAEENVVLNAARHGIATLGSIMYTNGTPCHECTKSIIQAGIRQIWVHKEWEELFKKSSSWYGDSFKLATTMLREADVPIKRCSMKLSVPILINGELVTL